MKPKDYTGQRFGALVALYKTENQNISGSYLWVFKCDCGKEYICSAASVKQKAKKKINKDIPSCGCNIPKAKGRAAKLTHTKHGYLSGTPHPLYSIYNAIMSRCYNKNTKSYKNYGKKGVTMCDEWLHSPAIFIEWCLANGWKPGLEIDKDTRVKNSKVYSPETCCFITKAENIKFSHSRETAFGKNKSIKLSPKEADEVVTLYATGQYSQQALGTKFNLSRSGIQRILRLAKKQTQF